MLPFDLKNYRANKPLIRRVATALSATAAVMLFVTGSRMIAPLPLAGIELDYKRIAAERTSSLVAVMRGEPYQVAWTDPHTGMEKIAVCEVHETGFITAVNDREHGGAK